MRQSFAISVVLATLCASSLWASGRDPAKNAALPYLFALNHIPAGYHRYDSWRIPISNPLTVSLDDARSLIEGNSIPLDYLRRGAKMPYCEWGLPDDGPHTLLDHAEESKVVTGLLLLSARLHLADGKRDAAIEDLNAALIFLRHVAADGKLVSWYVCARHQSRVAQLVAQEIPSLDAPELRKLASCLEHLPEPGSVSERLLRERDAFLGRLRRVAEQSGAGAVRQELCILAGGSSAPEELLQDVRKITVDEAVLSNAIGEAAELYDEAAQIASLPIAGFEPAAARFNRKVESGNPVARIFLLNFFGQPKLALRLAETRAEAQLRMLKAAVAVQLHGTAAIEKFRDPFGEGPFKLKRQANGFELTSAPSSSGEVFSITFGQRAISEEDMPTPVYDPKADANAEIAAALKEARIESRRVLVQFGANWCSSCIRLHQLLTSSEVAPLLREHFVYVTVNVNNFDRNMEVAAKYGADLQEAGVPYLVLLDADGEVIAKASMVEVGKDGPIDAPELKAFLKRWTKESR